MPGFDAAAYGPAVAALLRPERLMPLGPGEPNTAARAALESLDDKALFGPAGVRDRDMAAACRAALWLYHDVLDESHTISQGIETPTGGYWHGILHRREPDFDNARYWFRRVGRHPAFDAVRDAAAEVAAAEPAPEAACLTTHRAWDPFAFIDLCEASLAGRVPCEPLCRRVQLREWQALFDWTWRAAKGGGTP